MKIYTRKGDQGETGLLGGVRVRKDHVRVEAYGAVDELVSWLGLLRVETQDPELQAQLGEIQLELFFVNSELATPEGKKPFGELLESDSVDRLERWIDQCDQETPPLKSFILPGGSRVSAQLHVARTVCRRAERDVVRLMETEKLRDDLPRYLNRLSDLLFALARRENVRAGLSDVLISDLRAAHREGKEGKDSDS